MHDKLNGKALKLESLPGSCPFMAACEAGDAFTVWLLTIHTATRSSVDRQSGDTALVAACRKGHLSVVELLLEERVNARELSWATSDDAARRGAARRS
mmetsp:Transcript_20703/g.61760  ORF Transcript_20703/g.61760 Transcript_20703/m.61760 type:complete len:98 (+) Transcript_20703:597-890(+)